MARSNDRYAVQPLGNNLEGSSSDYRPRRRQSADQQQNKFSGTFLIILVSLLFVAIFGGALVGGVVSGDPSNGFFITIIAASGFAILVAAIVSLRYYCQQQGERRATSQFEEFDKNGQDIRGTFTPSEEEEDDEESPPCHRGDQGRHQRPPLPLRTPVESRIKEIDPSHMVAPGDVSAMSPHTYDLDTYTETESQFTRSQYQGNGYRIRINQPEQQQQQQPPQRRGFDFSSVACSTKSIPVREDPPEDDSTAIAYNSYCGLVSKDPVAAVSMADGNVWSEEQAAAAAAAAGAEEVQSPSGMSTTSRSVRSRYSVREEEEENSIAAASERGSTVMDKRGSKKDTIAPPSQPPRLARTTPSSRSAAGTPATAAAATAATASEAGSAVSSMFLKPFAGMFGKSKRATSEAGYSDASSFVKGSEVSGAVSGRRGRSKGAQVVHASSSASDIHPSTGNEGKPPMPGRKVNEGKRQGLDTIGGSFTEDRYAPSTPGKNSTFSIPPPRRVPSTPGSEAPSEFRSVAASSVYSNGVASSTFDPGAHDRALRRTQQNTVALGAAFNDMPIYYEDDESAIASAVQSEPTTRSVGYDVFAPPGPIGIVVDTMEKGCIVHSLKKSSPMQGLITPGDLIVALDDFDVRKMDAASLTKLMAKKSQQKERKFTLVPSDEY